MREERRNYLVVGAFVLAVLAGLLVWLAVLAGTTGPTDSYHVVYDRVMGLDAGTQVLYEGFEIGSVEDVVPQPDTGRFRVNLAVRKGWRIPEDAEAVVTVPSFLAKAVIDVRGGSSRTGLAPDSEIRAGSGADLISTVSSAAEELGHLMHEKVEPLLETLSEGTPEIVSNLREFSAGLNQTGDRLGAVLDPENVERVGAILANLEAASAEISRFGGDLNGTREQLDRLLSRVDVLLEENRATVDHAIDDLHVSLEAFAIRSDAIAHDLEITSRNLAEFSRQIRENPSLLLRGRGGSDPEDPN